MAKKWVKVFLLSLDTVIKFKKHQESETRSKNNYKNIQTKVEESFD